MARALITGYNGFTGRYVAAELKERGYEVFGLCHGSASLSDGLFACDLLDREMVQKIIKEVRPDYVVHLAAIAFVAHGDVDEMYRTNIVGTRNLLDALATSGHKPKKVLLASSANIYGNATVDPITEDTPPNPANDYAVSKMAMEAMARLWTDQLPIVIVRPFNYTGVGQTDNFLLPKIVGHFSRKESVIELGNLDVARDFSDVRNVARIYARLLELDTPSGETFNVCSGCSTTLSAVIGMLVESTGHNIEVKVNPKFVRNNEVKTLRGARAKLDKAIGEDQLIPLSDTLEWML